MVPFLLFCMRRLAGGEVGLQPITLRMNDASSYRPARAAKIPHSVAVLAYKTIMRAARPDSGTTKEDPPMRMLILAATAALLSGCGSSQFDRVSTGAGTGAGTGAAIGLLGGPIGVGLGAAIGAGVGAFTGGATTQDQIDLGKPVWK